MKSTVNLRDLVILVADPSAYTRRVINGMLRGFGANKILEAEQSTALAAGCETTEPPDPHQRCEPSCYRAEPADPRAGKKLGRAEIVHLACRSGDAESGPIVFADELGGAD